MISKTPARFILYTNPVIHRAEQIIGRFLSLDKFVKYDTSSHK